MLNQTLSYITQCTCTMVIRLSFVKSVMMKWQMPWLLLCDTFMRRYHHTFNKGKSNDHALQSQEILNRPVFVLDILKSFWKFWKLLKILKRFSTLLKILQRFWTDSEHCRKFWTDSENSEHYWKFWTDSEHCWKFWTLLKILNRFWTISFFLNQYILLHFH